MQAKRISELREKHYEDGLDVEDIAELFTIAGQLDEELDLEKEVLATFEAEYVMERRRNEAAARILEKQMGKSGMSGICMAIIRILRGDTAASDQPADDDVAISRKAVMAAIDQYLYVFPPSYGLDRLKTELKQHIEIMIPSAPDSPIVHGRLISHAHWSTDEYGETVCSACGRRLTWPKEDAPYCHCGAMMLVPFEDKKEAPNG